MLVKKTRYSVIGQLVLAAAVLFNAWSETSFATIAWFSMVLGVLNLGRYACLVYYPRFSADRNDLWFYVYGTLTVGTSTFWSILASWILYAFGAHSSFEVLMLVIIAGLASGSTAVLTPARKLAWTFITTLLLPLGLSMIFLTVTPQILVGFISFAFMLFLYAQVNLQTGLIWELRSRRNQVEAFEEATMDAIVIHDDGLIIDVNSSVERLFQYQKNELLGKNLQKLMPPEDQPEQFVYKDLNTPQNYRGQRKDGHVFPVEVTGRWFLYEGRKVRVTCIQDATSRKQAEQLLQEREKAALESAEVKAQFLANMSHEIRTPLNAVIGLTDLLLETEMTDLQKRYFRTLKESGESLIGLVNDILDFSKIDAQKIELENVQFSLASLLESQVSLLSSRAQQKGIGLHSLVAPDLPMAVMGDFGRVGQVLLNLLSNAIKFTASGSVLVTARPVGRARGEIRVRFEVKDTGMGIDDEQKSKLFKPFTQADNSTARKFGGTGLGLSICQKLVELMGGQIDMESEMKKGTTFWFELSFPIVDEKAIADSHIAKDWNLCRAVILSTDEALNAVLIPYLQSWNIPTQLMSTQNLSLQDTDIVFVLSGPVLDEVLAHWTLPNKKIIVIDQRGEMKAHKQGAVQAVVSLPLRYGDLFAAVTDTLSGQSKTNKVAAATEIQEFSGFRVLVAEDNSTNQLIILALLRQLGLNCHAVANGLEVVDAYITGEYDLILMDCQMPELDGFQATLRIREIEKAHHNRIPIIALTANVLREDRDRCLASGMDDFLSKPIRKQKLVDTLQKYLVDSAQKTA